MSPRIDVSMSPAEVAEFVAEPLTGVLSTNGPGGYPHAAGMWFVPAGDHFEMWTYAKSQKAVNLRRDPRASLLVEKGVVYAELRGVLVTGRVELIDDPRDVAKIGRALHERYVAGPQGVPLSVAEAEISRQANKRLGAVLVAEKIASWDHRKLGN